MAPPNKRFGALGIRDRRSLGVGRGVQYESDMYVSPPSVALLARVSHAVLKVSRPAKRLIMIGADAAMLPAALWFALVLKFDRLIDPQADRQPTGVRRGLRHSRVLDPWSVSSRHSLHGPEGHRQDGYRGHSYP